MCVEPPFLLEVLTVRFQTELTINTNTAVSDVGRDLARTLNIASGTHDVAAVTQNVVSDTYTIVSNTQNIVFDIHHAMLRNQGGIANSNLSVSLQLLPNN